MDVDPLNNLYIVNAYVNYFIFPYISICVQFTEKGSQSSGHTANHLQSFLNFDILFSELERFTVMSNCIGYSTYYLYKLRQCLMDIQLIYSSRVNLSAFF